MNETDSIGNENTNCEGVFYYSPTSPPSLQSSRAVANRLLTASRASATLAFRFGVAALPRVAATAQFALTPTLL